MRRKSCIVGVIACAAMAVGAASASAETLYVSNTVPVKGSGKNCSEPGFSTVQSAINSATGGATIEVCTGTYTEQLEIEKALKLNAINGAGTATVAMPATPARSTSACDEAELENGEHLEQSDEISICTPGTVAITNLNVEAVTSTAAKGCGGEYYGIFVGDGGTLKATTDTIRGASTNESGLLGCQYGVAIEVGYQKFSGSLLKTGEVGHASLSADTIGAYQKNGPTVKVAGSTLNMSNTTVTGVGASPYIAQNGVEVALGGKATITRSTVSSNECNVASCGARGEQASGVLFASAAAGSKITGSHIKENDLGVYYSSESSVVPAKPEVTVSTDVFTANRYEGVLLEEGKASLSKDTISGPGRVGIDLFQYQGCPPANPGEFCQRSASESKATETKIEGMEEAAIIVESDKSSKDIKGKFTFANGTMTGNNVVLINESNNFEVVF